MLRPDTFPTPLNITNLLVQAVPISLLAMGLVFVLLLGEIDLSAGVVSGVCAAVMAVMMARSGIDWWAVLAATAIGEHAAETGQPAGGLRVHRAVRAAHELRGLQLREVLVVAQHNRGAHPRRQGGESPAELLARVEPVGRLRGRDVGQPARGLLAVPGPAAPAGVRGDQGATHVRGRLAAPGDPVPVPVGLHQRRLHKILRVAAVAGEEECQAQQRLLLAGDEVGEGLLVLAEPAAHARPLAARCPLHAAACRVDRQRTVTIP